MKPTQYSTRSLIRNIASLFLACTLFAVPAFAGSTAELLEKGIYTEQTVGDLNAAIEIYREIVDQADAQRPHVAQARYRLAMCYLKEGREADAVAALERLVQDFPEQTDLVATAKEELDALKPSLDLQSAPWADGEALAYRILLPTGKQAGSVRFGVISTTVDGVPAWFLEMRRFGFSGAENYGVSRMWIDRETFQPLRSTLRHGALGDADAVWSPGGVVINGTEIESDGDLYDNDQSMHLTRLLPLEPGYEASYDLVPLWTATTTRIDMKVEARETCETAVGEFECDRVVSQAKGEENTHWYSTGPERYMLKLQTGGVTLELADIGRFTPETPADFEVGEMGFSGELPAGWLPHVQQRSNRAAVRMLDDEAAAVSSIEIDLCPGKCPDLRQTAERERAGAENRFQDYVMRDGSWAERTIDGRPAISFVGDYVLNDEPWVQYRIYTISDSLRIETIFRVPADRFEDMKPSFDAILASFQADS